MPKAKSKKTDEQTIDDKGFFKEFIKPVTIRAFRNMKWRNLKSTFGNKVERNLYITSFFVNPLALYFLTHNKYFFLRLDLKLYGLVALTGYFFQKGTLQFIQENNGISIGKKRKCLSKNKHEKHLCNALNNLDIPHKVTKITSNDFLTRMYVLSDTPIAVMKSKNAEIAKRMHIDEKDLIISVVKGHFTFDIRNPKQEKYYFDEYINKIDKKQLKDKELPFILGINQVTGKLIVEDLGKLLHCLVSGTSGGGKSSFVNNFIQSLMLFGSDILFLLIDFKGNELIQYKHFSNCLFIREHKRLNDLLNSLTIEMEHRYKRLVGCPDVQSYNKKNPDNKIPYIVVIIDEAAEITLDKNMSEELNDKILRLLNMGRASGIFFEYATQRPSGTQIDTDNRAILQTKITFMVTSKKETQFTETTNADKLIEGEFIIKSPRYKCEKFKGLFVDREDEKRNIILKKLENKFAKGGKNNVFSVNLDK